MHTGISIVDRLRILVVVTLGCYVLSFSGAFGFPSVLRSKKDLEEVVPYLDDLLKANDLRALLRQKRDGYGASLGISGYGASVGSREGEAYAAGMSPTMIAMLINAINQALAQSATTPAASGGGDNRHLQALIPVHLRTQQH
ncbi:uncharacterized protein LOC129587154 isoform X1 [Paramacrobiotus metropolitanus]|uniref:uncharacterized protein LOC129587154 isoform X1 n=1 Tax=Paramacrobiotus metropolitanus TaxID=2943436 RepID=UPI0024465C82|nr:uncharacterized protein LOC129587154 isoform X1 [Paramacrobiotus metropolitanus]